MKTAQDAPADETAGLVIIGQGALTGADGEAVLAMAMQIAEARKAGLLVLHTAAGRVGAMDVGAVTEGGLEAAMDGAEVIYSLGADEVEIPRGPFVIYQGSHGDRGAHRADVILPARRLDRGKRPVRQHRGPPAAGAIAPVSRRARRRRTGRSCARSRVRWERRCPTTRWRRCAGRWSPRCRTSPRSTRCRKTPGPRLRPASPATAICGLAVSEFYLTNPIARASALMGELARMARERASAPQMAAE